MNTQLEPPAPHARTPLFRVTPDHSNVRWLLRLLKEHGWQTRREIAEAIRTDGLTVSASYSERWVRAVAEAAGAKIVKGQAGFNHIDNCTIEEILHAANQSISQGKLMIKYGIALKQQAHRRVA